MKNNSSKNCRNIIFQLCHKPCGFLFPLPVNVMKFGFNNSFFHNVKDTLPPSDACFYDCIKWTLAEAKQESSHVAKPDPKLITGLMSKSNLHQILVVHLWQRSPTLKLDLRNVRTAGSHLVMHLAVQQILSRKIDMGMVFLVCHRLLLHCHHLHQLCRLVLFPILCISGQVQVPASLCLICFKGHHLQHRCCPLLFYYVKQFIVKATLAHYLVIQREVNEL